MPSLPSSCFVFFARAVVRLLPAFVIQASRQFQSFQRRQPFLAQIRADARSHQQLDLRRTGQQLRQQPPYLGQVLEVVQHQQQVFVAEKRSELGLRVGAGRRIGSACTMAAAKEIGGGDRRQIDEPDAVGENLVSQRGPPGWRAAFCPCRPDRAPSAGDRRDRPGAPRLRQFPLATDEGRGVRRQVVNGGQASRGAEVPEGGGRPRADGLEQRRRFRLRLDAQLRLHDFDAFRTWGSLRRGRQPRRGAASTGDAPAHASGWSASARRA